MGTHALAPLPPRSSDRTHHAVVDRPRPFPRRQPLLSSVKDRAPSGNKAARFSVTLDHGAAGAAVVVACSHWLHCDSASWMGLALFAPLARRSILLAAVPTGAPDRGERRRPLLSSNPSIHPSISSLFARVRRLISRVIPRLIEGLSSRRIRLALAAAGSARPEPRLFADRLAPRRRCTTGWSSASTRRQEISR